jgi:hypothetical protein
MYVPKILQNKTTNLFAGSILLSTLACNVFTPQQIEPRAAASATAIPTFTPTLTSALVDYPTPTPFPTCTSNKVYNALKITGHIIVDVPISEENSQFFNNKTIEAAMDCSNSTTRVEEQDIDMCIRSSNTQYDFYTPTNDHDVLYEPREPGDCCRAWVNLFGNHMGDRYILWHDNPNSNAMSNAGFSVPTFLIEPVNFYTERVHSEGNTNLDYDVAFLARIENPSETFTYLKIEFNREGTTIGEDPEAVDFRVKKIDPYELLIDRSEYNDDPTKILHLNCIPE